MKGKVTAERFVDVWLVASQRGRNILWVAQELGVSHQAVYDRAARLRARGVPLPKLPKSNRQEAELLAARIAETLSKRAET
jgi:hypothetical protein